MDLYVCESLVSSMREYIASGVLVWCINISLSNSNNVGMIFLFYQQASIAIDEPYFLF
jgi:hypothetical protein